MLTLHYLVLTFVKCMIRQFHSVKSNFEWEYNVFLSEILQTNLKKLETNKSTCVFSRILTENSC